MRRMVMAGAAAVVTVVFGLSVLSEAAVLCARARSDGTFSTSLKIREACRPSETQLNPAALGLQGPPGPSPGFTCASSCVSGFPTVQFSCGAKATSCSTMDGFNPVRETFIDCVTEDSLAFPFCLNAECREG